MLKKYIFLLVASFVLLSVNNTYAQNVLHEASVVTQSHATISADFLNTNTIHGFQYKYGEIKEIDEFSKVALSKDSDPIQINTKGYTWNARGNKGWVESSNNLPEGKSSTMSTTVTLHNATTISFLWSVDSEEGVGFLSFIVDGKTVQTISGSVSFRQLTCHLTQGKHTLEWQFKKNAESNVGLDLGMVKNINIQNSTEGEWITKEIKGNSITLDNLYPGQKYIYRAFSKNALDDSYNYSSLGNFSTLPIQIGTIIVNPITQTSANINSKIDLGDANVTIDAYYGVKKQSHSCSNLEENLINQKSTLIDFSFTTGWDTRAGKVYTKVSTKKETITASVLLTKQTKISFGWNCYGWQGNSLGSKTSSMIFYIDNKQVAKIENAEYKSTYDHVSVTIPSGYHNLKWVADLAGGSTNYPAYGSVAFLDITNISPFTNEANHQSSITLPIKINNLTPDTNYGVFMQINPNFTSELEKRWNYESTDLVYFKTLNVSVSTKEATRIKQASATINGNVNCGDATIIAVGMQYKDAKGSRWTDLPQNMSSSVLSHNLSRLKPNTSYNYRAYIQVQNCDKIYSNVRTFTTLPVQAIKPQAISVRQHEVSIRGEVLYGDAAIYQKGIQFRKKGDISWTDFEFKDNDSIFILKQKNLDLGSKYEARTYVQPAGNDVIYSDILELNTLDNYFKNNIISTCTQCTIKFTAELAEIDENAIIEEYGFEYYIEGNGMNSYDKADTVRIHSLPYNNQVTVTATGLAPFDHVRFRSYVKTEGKYIYYSGNKRLEWGTAFTNRATIKIIVKEIKQTSLALEIDNTQDGDASITQMEYALKGNISDPKEFHICDNNLKINKLFPDSEYHLEFRGTVNGRVCPLLLDINSDFSDFQFMTKVVNIFTKISSITQTRATMITNIDNGDAEIEDLKFRINDGDYKTFNNVINFNKLKPATIYTIIFVGKINGKEYYWSKQPNSNNEYKFKTKAVEVDINSSNVEQTFASLNWSYDCGDATFVSSGINYGKSLDMEETTINQTGKTMLNELIPNTTYYWEAFVETVEGGKVYSTRRSFKTTSINCTTLSANSISNRSAQLNGTIFCDEKSSAEFGFQWKQMQGWNTEPAFTKGFKNADGTISVALINGMLEPNTDYQYRTAVRYKGNIYYASNWETFRTESEFVYYPAKVYTVFRTDRENNCLILCGYYIAGSEDIITQGYEYWSEGSSSANVNILSNSWGITQISTNETMQYSLKLNNFANGTYYVRAFIKTKSGTTIYGETLPFIVQDGNATGIETVMIKNKTLDFKIVEQSHNKITIKLKGLQNEGKYNLYSINGLNIVHGNLNQTNAIQQIQIPNLTSGIYLLKVSDDKQSKVVRLIIR